MRKARKALIAAVCACALALGAAGSLAYFTDSDAAVNTFTVGKVDISLDEGKLKDDGLTVDTSDRVKANKYHLIPGQTYEKDPTVHVDADSDDCWLFVKVENDIAKIEDKDKTIASQMAANGWTPVSGETDVYAYKTIVSRSANVAVFSSFTIDGAGVNNATLAKYDSGAEGTAAITVTAYAVQAAGFDTAKAAWDAAFAGK